MATPKKTIKKLKHEMNMLSISLLDEYVPNWADNHPESWDDWTKMRFDLISEFERRSTSIIDEVLSA